MRNGAGAPSRVGDKNHNRLRDRIVRFDRWGLRAALAGLPPGTRQVILIEGRTTDGRRFEGRTSGRIGADREREDDDEDDRD